MTKGNSDVEKALRDATSFCDEAKVKIAEAASVVVALIEDSEVLRKKIKALLAQVKSNKATSEGVDDAIDESAEIPDDISGLIEDPEQFRQLYMRLSTAGKNELMYRMNEKRKIAEILIPAGFDDEGDEESEAYLSGLLDSCVGAYRAGQNPNAKTLDVDDALNCVEWLKEALERKCNE
jgi:hypothetical protein